MHKNSIGPEGPVEQDWWSEQQQVEKSFSEQSWEFHATQELQNQKLVWICYATFSMNEN